MDAAALRNLLTVMGGVIPALKDGYRDYDIDDEGLAEMWYELQVQYDNIAADISEIEDYLQDKLSEEPVLD